MTDNQITDLLFDRDERALAEIEIKYGKLLFSVAYGILGDKCDSEECANDCLLSVWNAIPPARPPSLRAYLLQTVRRRALDRYKEKHRKKRIPSELTVSMDDLYAALESGEETARETDSQQLREHINTFLRSLPSRRRYIFIERYYSASAVKAIAKDLKISVRSVYKEIDKIKQDLLTYLSENEVF